MPDELAEMLSGGAAAKAAPAQDKAAEKAPEQAGHKIGEGHAMAMLRLGGHELTNLLQAFPDSIRPIEEPGVFGNENAPQRVPSKETAGLEHGQSEQSKDAKPSNDEKEPAKANVEPAKEMSLQEMLDSPAPPTPPTQERDNGREM